MPGTPLTFLGPVDGKRVLLWGVGVEAVGFAIAGADVYGFDCSSTRVETVKDLARSLELRDQTHLQTMAIEELAYPDDFFDLAFGRTTPDDADLELGARELARVMKPGGRGAFIIPAGAPAERLVQRAFGSSMRGESWIGVEKTG